MSKLDSEYIKNRSLKKKKGKPNFSLLPGSPKPTRTSTETFQHTGIQNQHRNIPAAQSVMEVITNKKTPKNIKAAGCNWGKSLCKAGCITKILSAEAWEHSQGR